jgi:hypothetical protein
MVASLLVLSARSKARLLRLRRPDRQVLQQQLHDEGRQ